MLLTEHVEVGGLVHVVVLVGGVAGDDALVRRGEVREAHLPRKKEKRFSPI